jgi:hypothetical protein
MPIEHLIAAVVAGGAVATPALLWLLRGPKYSAARIERSLREASSRAMALDAAGDAGGVVQCKVEASDRTGSIWPR